MPRCGNQISCAMVTRSGFQQGRRVADSGRGSSLVDERDEQPKSPIQVVAEDVDEAVTPSSSSIAIKSEEAVESVQGLENEEIDPTLGDVRESASSGIQVGFELQRNRAPCLDTAGVGVQLERNLWQLNLWILVAIGWIGYCKVWDFDLSRTWQQPQS